MNQIKKIEQWRSSATRTSPKTTTYSPPAGKKKGIKLITKPPQQLISFLYATSIKI